MSPHAPLLASILAASLLLAFAPTAQADVAVEPPVCQHIVTGPDIHFGVCTDPTADCALWTYNYGGDTCYVPGAGATADVPRAHCERLLYGPDIDQGVCYDLDGEYVDGMACIVWWYSAYSTGQDQCYVPAPPLAASSVAVSHDTRPIVCVGDEGPELPGVCYDPDDYDGCDVYAGLGGGNQLCLVPALGTCPSSTPEWPGVCWTPRQECQLWIGLGGVYCIYPVSASTTGASADAAAPPRAHCEQLLVGPDIDQGICYDLDGQYVAGMNCVVWWYSTYSTGQDACYVPYPPGAVALSTTPTACVGDESAGACYEPNDGDRCDAYVTFHHGNYVCVVPARSPVSVSTVCVGDESAGACYDPDDDRCDAYVTFHHGNYVCIVRDLSGITASTAGPSTASADAAPSRAHCEQLLVGPDIDSGLCYDLDGEQVNGRECIVWWYANYVGTTTCYVPQPVTSGIDETCYHVADNPHARSVCHDTSRDTCQVWAEGTGADRCLT